MSGYLTFGSHSARGRTFGDQTITSRIELTYDDGRQVKLEETLASVDAPAATAALVTALIGYLQSSPFAVPQVQAIKVSLLASEHLERAEILDAVPERTLVQPGDRLGVRVRLHPSAALP